MRHDSAGGGRATTTSSATSTPASRSPLPSYAPTSTFLPGLLQEQSYCEALPPIVGIEDPAKIRRHMEARLTRQEILVRPQDPCRLEVVIDENALARIVDTIIRERQQRHLLTMSDLPNVAIQLIPTTVGRKGPDDPHRTVPPRLA
ncbi:Scr1 family TA system antitoxin-like transcriptional regulator [Actinomadura fibrosa]|uniref:Scr1 family TA system antitoxin-like transcriptional regulator n=1 Tax=Actinomadura fibrosa TaxID=111802 RepID=A0ABW2XFB2_9ACTN